MLDTIKNGLFSPAIIGLLVLVAVLAIANARGKRGEALRRGLGSLLGGVASVWKEAPGVGAFGKMLSRRFDGEWAQRWMDKRFADSPNPMLRGKPSDRLEYARQTIPESRYPSVWIKDTPEDIKRSLVSDGKQITGAPMSTIAEASITAKHQSLAAKAGATAFAVWFSLMVVAWHPGLFLNGFSSNSLAGASADVAKVAADDATIGKTLSKDYWDSAAYSRAIAERKSELTAPREASISPQLVLLDLASSLVVATLVGLLMAVSTFRGVFRAALAAIGRDIHDGTKEQVVRHKFRAEQRDMEYKAYCAQLDLATKHDRSPLIDLGAATSIFRFRGSLGAPYKGQRIKMSLIDLKQNLLIFGGTGQGKTRTVIKPILNQLLEIRRIQRDRAIELRRSYLARVNPTWSQDQVAAEAARIPKSQASSVKAAGEFAWPWGVQPNFDRFEPIVYPLDISTYLTDGKAVLYHDMREIASKLRLEDDLMVIGTNEARGEVSVDLLDGIKPRLVSDIIRSVARQSGGENSGEDIWPDMAAQVILSSAVLARAFDCTDEGIEWVRLHRGERPYSLVFIYQLAIDKGPLLQTILSALGRAEDDPDLYPRIKEFCTTELEAAIGFMQGEWLTMVPETRNGIQINITNALSGFSFDPVLRASFAGGAAKNQVSPDQFWGRLCVTNVSTDTFGTPGKIINVFLKTLFMIEATRRERDTKEAKAAIEQQFFEMFPRLSEIDCSIEEVAVKLDNKDLYTPSQHQLFQAYSDAAHAADDALDLALSAAHIEAPAATGEVLQDIAAKEPLLSQVPASHKALVDACEDALRELGSAKGNFGNAYASLARKRVFLSDPRTLDPRKIADAIDARGERLLQDLADYFDARGVDNTITTTREAIRAAHKLYYQWHVLHTRLDGSGEGAIREQMFFIADEYQTLITVDVKDGAPSDSSFPNKSRSTGVALIIATQTYAALKQAVGEVAADNFCHQMRSKISLGNEDTASLEFIKKLAGKALRSYVYEDDGFESYDAMLMQGRVSDLALDGVPDIAILNDDPSNAALLAAGAEMAFEPSAIVTANDAVRNHDKTKNVKMPFVPELRKVRGKGGNIDSNEDQRLAARQQAQWRYEDLQHKSLSEGNQEMEIFRDDDFKDMGRNHAFMHIQRAGKVRQDFVELDDESNRAIVL